MKKISRINFVWASFVIAVICFVLFNTLVSANTEMPFFSDWEPYATSEEFATYSPDDRDIIRRQWFKENVVSLPEFQALPEQKRIAIFNRFIEKSIAIEEYVAEPSDMEAMKNAAEKGFALAQCHLGIVYYRGHGADRDYKKAVKYWRMASEQGHVEAQGWMGTAYSNGNGVPKDYRKALEWWKIAAEQGDPHAQSCLSNAYYEGEGVPEDYTYAYIWISLAAAQDYMFSVRQRDLIAKLLTSEQLSQARKIAFAIQKRIDDSKTRTGPPPSLPTPHRNEQLYTIGTGFLVTRDGYILTCEHVVDAAISVEVKIQDIVYPAKVVKIDPANDLALLKIAGNFSALSFSAKSTIKMGQEVFTIGFPNPELQGMNPKLTKGVINSLTGFQDDIRLYQISVAAHPGNSGGPLLDMDGNVVGIIVAVLDAKTTYNLSGSLPQNINYAVKSTYAQAFLSSIPDVSEKLPPPQRWKNVDSVVERASRSVVMVLSY